MKKPTPTTSIGLIVIAVGAAYYGYEYAAAIEQTASYVVAVIAFVAAAVFMPRQPRYQQ